MKPLRIYTDTSVIGGCLDTEFKEYSLRFLDNVRQGRFVILLSDMVITELQYGPEQLGQILTSLPISQVEDVPLTKEVFNLRNLYIQAGILSSRWIADATHVAAATVARADAIVSWNFKHIVRLDKIKSYNHVNFLNGYGVLTILSPKEVVPDEQG
jgi:hypothetical protein